jgi:Uma2 family endonuclease
MALQTMPTYTFDDYLAVEREAIDEKHEYAFGRVYAMTVASYNHNLIVANLSRRLGNQLEPRRCSVLTSDMRVRIETADACKYPDIVVLCDEPQFYDDRNDVLLNPILVVEVLSPSTEAYDRGGKFAIYRALPSLQEYVLVAQDRLSVEVFTRQPYNRWLLTTSNTADNEVVFDSIQCEIPMREIYDKVQIAGPGAPEKEASV